MQQFIINKNRIWNDEFKIFLKWENHLFKIWKQDILFFIWKEKEIATPEWINTTRALRNPFGPKIQGHGALFTLPWSLGRPCTGGQGYMPYTLFTIFRRRLLLPATFLDLCTCITPKQQRRLFFFRFSFWLKAPVKQIEFKLNNLHCVQATDDAEAQEVPRHISVRFFSWTRWS